jgi:LysM repeat protein
VTKKKSCIISTTDLIETLESPKTQLSQTKSLSTSDNDLQSKSSVTRGVKYSQSLRVKRDAGGSSSKADRSGWSLGNMAKALGTGVVQGTKAVSSGVVQGTKAVGSGVVQGTKAVGSGVVQGSIVVGSGVVQGSKAVGTGVVQGTKAVGTGVVAAGRMTKDVTIAVGKGVYQASEDVVNAAVTGVSAAGEATVTAGRVVTNVSVSAVNETTKWVKEQSESFGGDDHESYTVLPGDTLDSVALDHGVTVYDLIRLNTLYKRALIPGKQLLIPDESDQVSSNLPFPVTGAAAKWARVFVPSRYILRGRKEPNRVEQLRVLHSLCRLLGPYSQNFIFFLT